MFLETVDQFAGTAVAKAEFLRRSPLGFTISSMMAGAYVGLGIIAIFSIGQGLDPSVRPLAMGLTFAIALTLVVFAGAELFTGVVPAMLHGLVARKVTVAQLGLVWVASWIGNLAGSLLFAAAVNASGILSTGAVNPATHHTAMFAALAGTIKGKVGLTAGQLFWRAVLCNFLVCLGLWMAARATSDGAKLVVLWWALLAFVATGFEHSVANMTVFGLGIFAHVPLATAANFETNLLWVTLGNIVGTTPVNSSAPAKTTSASAMPNTEPLTRLAPGFCVVMNADAVASSSAIATPM